jgi:dipeptidyl-peptidase-4
MAESFARQQARTRRFTLGVPRAFRVSPDGGRVAFLRTKSGTDPLACLWVIDVATGTERLVADPASVVTGEENLPPEERARRERVRETSGGIVAYAADAALRTATFTLSGHVYAVDLTGETGQAVTGVPTLTPALDPRPDPAGRRVAYVSGGALRVADLAGAEGTAGTSAQGRAAAGGPAGNRPAAGQAVPGGPAGDGPAGDRAVADPGGAPGVTFGLAEFVAAEEMGRTRGYWWAPDGSALLAARVDETPVMRWHIADPANPDRPPTEAAYPAAGTPNADVSLVLATLDGRHTPIRWDRAAFPYLVTVCWTDPAGSAPPLPATQEAREGREPGGTPDAAVPGNPLVVVQSRDQRRMRILAVDPATGQTYVLREDTDPHWVDIVPGVPAWTPSGRLVWTADADGARRLLVATPAELAAGTAAPVTPPGLQVRQILDTGGDTVLFTASEEPAEIGLWTWGPHGLARVPAGPGVHTGRRAGGTTVVISRSLDDDAPSVRLLRDRGDGAPAPVASIESRAERPNLPAPRPALLSLGRRAIRAALLFPSWHTPRSARLPVLLDPYGGPHAQRVLAARGAYLISQWFAEQGFAVLVADGRGTPGRGPGWERAVTGDLAGPVLDDQVDALHAAAETYGDLDLSRVAIRGWSFGGYLAALAVLRRPDVFHAAVAGAPVTDWHLYDTHYTERYLGHPGKRPGPYDACSLIGEAERADKSRARPLMLIHGLADDNVVVAHTLRLSSALLAAGYPHTVLPLSGVTHMTPQEVVAENLLFLQLDFLRRALGAGGTV